MSVHSWLCHRYKECCNERYKELLSMQADGLNPAATLLPLLIGNSSSSSRQNSTHSAANRKINTSNNLGMKNMGVYGPGSSTPMYGMDMNNMGGMPAVGVNNMGVYGPGSSVGSMGMGSSNYNRMSGSTLPMPPATGAGTQTPFGL